MATFSKSTFSAKAYAAFRPTYPTTLFTTLLDYHRGAKKLCVDLGTGHGLAAREMSKHFERAAGSDPSAGMIQQAMALTTEPNVSFHIARADALDWVEDGTLDMVMAGQAAHWFNHAELWAQLRQKMSPQGTLAFWGYKDAYFVDNARATDVYMHYCYGPGADLMGMYWEQPGRNILKHLYRDITPPAADWQDEVRLTYEPASNGPRSGTGVPLIFKELTLGAMEAYLRTYSAFHGWQQAHPDRKALSDGGQGDLVDELMLEIRKTDPKWLAAGDDWRDQTAYVEWGTVVLMARRR